MNQVLKTEEDINVKMSYVDMKNRRASQNRLMSSKGSRFENAYKEDNSLTLDLS